MHIQCVSHSIFNSGQHFTLSFSSYSSHAAVVPIRLLIAHPPAPALGTYTGWRWSILYWYTGWRWSILYSGDVGVEHRSLETCELTCDYPFPMHIQAFRIQFVIQANISHCPSLLTLPMSCSAYQTSYSASPGSRTGYVYTMSVEHSLLVYRMAVEHSLLVYRMEVEHSLHRRCRSGTS